MPTLSKLIAALAFGALGWVVSAMMVTVLPEEIAPPASFALVNAGLGLLVGWKFCGAKSGHGFASAAGVGFTTSVLLTFAALSAWAFADMMRRSMRLAFDGPSDAIMAGIASGIDFGAVLASHPPALVVLAVSGVLIGLVAEPFAERVPGG